MSFLSEAPRQRRHVNLQVLRYITPRPVTLKRRRPSTTALDYFCAPENTTL